MFQYIEHAQQHVLGWGRSGAAPGGCGSVRDAGDGSPAQQQASEARWQVAVAQAVRIAEVRGRSDLPTGLARAVEEIIQPSVPWPEVLREFLTRTARNEYRWNRPNRRIEASLVGSTSTVSILLVSFA
jgi:hypothetical protein